MQKRGWTLLIILACVAAVVVLAIIFWPWLSRWLPRPELVEAWIGYLVVDLNIGRWGPVATLLLVAIIELVWALNLGRKSGAFERQWSRMERLQVRELEVLNQEIAIRVHSDPECVRPIIAIFVYTQPGYSNIIRFLFIINRTTGARVQIALQR